MTTSAPAPRRPWQRRDRFAVAWVLASLNALMYLAYCGTRWYAASVPNQPPMDPYRFDVGYAVGVTVVTLLPVSAAVALLWRHEISRHIAILAHCLICIPLALVMTGLPSHSADPKLVILAFIVLGIPVAVIVLLQRRVTGQPESS